MKKAMWKTIWWSVFVIGIIIFVMTAYSYNWTYVIANITLLGWIMYSIAVILVLTGAANLLIEYSK